MHSVQTEVFVLAVALATFPRPANAQSGALIGVATEREVDNSPGGPPPAFQTLWITNDGARARHVLAIPALVLPRRDGFWRLGLTRVCERDGDTTNQSERDVLWIVPVSRTPVVTQGPACAPIVTPPAGMVLTNCGFVHLAITFVSPEFVAVSRVAGQSEDCEPRGNRDDDSATVRRLDSIDTPLGYEAVVGSGARRAYEAALRLAANELRQTNPGCRDLDESDPSDELPEWFIQRRAGQWRARVFLQPGLADCQYANEIQQPLPLAVTGYDKLGVPWASIVAAVPQATDAFSSPAGDMLIVVAPNELQVFGARAGSLGQKLVTVPAGRVIMIQWALSRNVARWATAMRQFAAKPLPEPAIRSGSELR